MVNVDSSSLHANSQPKSVDLVWNVAAIRCCVLCNMNGDNGYSNGCSYGDLAMNICTDVIIHANGSRGVGFTAALACFFICTISQQRMQLGSPNVIQNCSTISPGNPFILGWEGQRSRPRVTKALPAWVFHSCGCCLLGVILLLIYV